MSEILEDGHATYYTFSSHPSIAFKEIDTTPPGVDAGGAVVQTSMRNEVWRTAAPKVLKTLTDGKATVAYDPAVYPDIIEMAGVNQSITCTYPDGDTVVFWGWLNKFQPTGHKEGDRPTADIEIMVSNRNDSQMETGPEWTAAP